DQRFVDTWTMGVAGYDTVGAIKFDQDVFVVVDVSRDRCAGIDHFLFYSSPQAIVFVVYCFCCSGYSNELVLCIVLIANNGPTNFRSLTGHVAVVVVLIGEVGVFQKLVRLIERGHSVLVRVGAVAQGIVGEGFQRIGRQWINCLDQTIQRIVGVICRPIVVHLGIPILHLVVGVVEGINGRRSQLMSDTDKLRRHIIIIIGYHPVGMRHRCSSHEGIIGESGCLTFVIGHRCQPI